MKIRKAGEKFSQRKDDQRAIDDLKKEIPELVSAFDSFPQGQRDRNADDKKKEGKDEIGGRPAVPLRVFQRPIRGWLVASIVH